MGRTDGQTDGRTEGRTDGRSDCTPRPAFAFGDAGKNTSVKFCVHLESMIFSGFFFTGSTLLAYTSIELSTQRIYRCSVLSTPGYFIFSEIILLKDILYAHKNSMTFNSLKEQ